MSANVDSLINEAIRAFRAKKKDEARALLDRALELDENSEKAWMWMSAVVDDDEDRRICLENVLVINPDNENAKKGLASLDATPPPQPDNHGSIATSSASATHDPNSDLSPDEYDDWISSMPLGQGAGQDYADIDFGFDDDEMNDPPPAQEQDAASAIAETFGFNDDDLRGQFDPADFEDDLVSEFIDEDDYDEAELDPFQAELAAAANNRAIRSEPVMSPIEEDDYDYDEDEDLLFDDDLLPADNLDYFEMIPSEIKATRLPGSGGRGTSPLVVIGIVVLLVLNLGAAGLLLVNMM